MTCLPKPTQKRGNPHGHHTRPYTTPRSSPSSNRHQEQTSPTTGDQQFTTQNQWKQSTKHTHQDMNDHFPINYPLENDVQKSNLKFVVLHIWSRTPSKLTVSSPIKCPKYPHSYPIPSYQSTDTIPIFSYSYPIPKFQNTNIVSLYPCSFSTLKPQS